MKILLLMDNRGDSNWGSQATTTKLVHALKEQFPGAEIQGVRRKAAGIRGISRKLAEAILPWSLRLGSWNDPITCLALRLCTKGWQHLIDWPDLIVMNGEGTLHSQGQVKRWLPLAAWLKQRRGCPLWVVNTSIELEDRSYTRLFRVALSYADRVVVREPFSAEVARDLGVEAEVSADCAFLATPDEDFDVDAFLERIGVKKPFAIVTGSAVGKYWQPSDARSVLDSARKRGLDLLFAASTGDDRDLYTRLALQLPLVGERDLTPYQYMSLIREAEVMIGGRFHPSIFAAKVGTPFVASESNTHKMPGTMQLLGTPELLVPISDPARQAAMLDHILANRADYSEKLRRRAAELACVAKRNAEGPLVSKPVPERTSSLLWPSVATAGGVAAFFLFPNSWVVFGLVGLTSLLLANRVPSRTPSRLSPAVGLVLLLAAASLGGDLYDGGLIDHDGSPKHERVWYLGL